MEADALVGIQDGALPDHGLEPAHAAEGVLDLDLANDGGAVSLDLFEELALGWDSVPQGGLEIWLGRGRVWSLCWGDESSSQGLKAEE